MDDLDELIKRLCLRLAGSEPQRLPARAPADGAIRGPSRRGFLATMGKVAVGAAAAVAGTAIFTRPSEAASALHCCEGIACPFHGCYHGMALGYTWSCAGYFCHDCFTNFGHGHYFCTYTVARAHTTSHSASHHSSHPAAATQGYGGYGEYGPYGGYGYGGYGGYGPPDGYGGWG